MTEGISQYTEKERKLPEIVHIGEFGTPNLPYFIDIDTEELAQFLGSDLEIAPDEIAKIRVEIAGDGIDEFSESSLFSPITDLIDIDKRTDRTMGVCKAWMENGKRVVRIYGQKIYDDLCKHMGEGINEIRIPDKQELGYSIIKDVHADRLDDILLNAPIDQRLDILSKLNKFAFRTGVMEVMAHELKHAKQNGFSSIKDVISTLLKASPVLLGGFIGPLITLNLLPPSPSINMDKVIAVGASMITGTLGYIKSRRDILNKLDAMEGPALEYGYAAVDKRLSNGMMKIVKVRKADINLPI
ncbi:MAG TPA: hypothetical protein PLV59_00315 [Candidatus Dojkabacteria bacterium]|nr:hypothetical protein [Candidatus Dojkabacteria bacterium]